MFGAKKSAPAPKPKPVQTATSQPHYAPAPAKTTSAPPPAAPAQSNALQPMGQQGGAMGGMGGGGGGMMSGIGGAIVSGMAMGTGSAIAHRAVDAVAGPRKMIVEHQGEEQDQKSGGGAFDNSNKCSNQYSAFQKCMSENNQSMSFCNFFFKSLSKCQSESGTEGNF